jgi:hypothetical protein
MCQKPIGLSQPGPVVSPPVKPVVEYTAGPPESLGFLIVCTHPGGNARVLDAGGECSLMHESEGGRNHPPAPDFNRDRTDESAYQLRADETARELATLAGASRRLRGGLA